MRLWRRPNLIVNAALGALVLGGALLAYQTVSGSAAKQAASTSRDVTVSTGTVTATVTAAGTVQSASTASADFATSGTVTEIDVRVGQAVGKGQVLAKVDPTSAQQQLTTAKANLTALQDALGRAQASSASDAATIASAQASVTQAQATVDSDQRALDGTVLKAPMAGTVVAINGSVGASSGSTSGSSGGGGSSSGSTGSGSTGGGSGGGASSSGGGSSGGSTGSGSTGGSSSGSGSSGFVQLADLSQMQVSGYFAEADTTKIKSGQPATVTWNALSGTRVTGKVASISPTATTQNSVNSYGVLVSLDSLPTGIKIGQTTTIVVTVAEADNVVRVPTAAVRAAGNRYTVQVVTSTGATQTTAIEVGVAGDSYYEVTSGLTAGQTVTITRSATTGSSTGTNGFPGGGGLNGGGLGGLNGGGGLGGGGR